VKLRTLSIKIGRDEVELVECPRCFALMIADRLTDHTSQIHGVPIVRTGGAS
jgi:uncharacterized C2H2 Zn-finger protein